MRKLHALFAQLNPSESQLIQKLLHLLGLGCCERRCTEGKNNMCRPLAPFCSSTKITIVFHALHEQFMPIRSSQCPLDWLLTNFSRSMLLLLELRLEVCNLGLQRNDIIHAGQLDLGMAVAGGKRRLGLHMPQLKPELFQLLFLSWNEVGCIRLWAPFFTRLCQQLLTCQKCLIEGVLCSKAGLMQG